MPNFESMKKHYSPIIVGNRIKEMSNMVMNETFSNSTSYRQGKIYDCNMNYLQDIDFKFLKTQTYTISKDQVEYWVQFRPRVNPEIDYKSDNIFDYNYRFGFYLDILDENSQKIEKWLIVGKDNDEFDKYLVLRCNWTFEWLDNDRNYYRCLGVVRDRNNYNSWRYKTYISTARYNWKHYSVFLLICWKILRDIILKQNNEICIYV